MFKEMIKRKAYQFASAAARNSLVAIGAYEVGRGHITDSQSVVLVNAGMILLGVAWSFARKHWPHIKF